ncbi:MAG: hypothetical protein FJW22_10310 [Acidimicrobiia bacterium]|nr:hypothetical protein [Acidimicrobiia bacterium]
MLAKLLDGALVSTTGCAAAEDVPSLNAMWFDEFGISALVSPTFERPGICHRRLHDARRHPHLLTSQCPLRREPMAACANALDQRANVGVARLRLTGENGLWVERRSELHLVSMTPVKITDDRVSLIRRSLHSEAEFVACLLTINRIVMAPRLGTQEIENPGNSVLIGQMALYQASAEHSNLGSAPVDIAENERIHAI